MRARTGAILREMGLAPLWRLRAGDAPGSCDDESMQASAEVGAAEVDAMNASAPPAAPDGPRAVAKLLAEMDGAPVVKAASPELAGEAPAPRGEDSERAARIARLDWDALEADIRDCKACALCERRIQAVPGVGDRKAAWLFVGEGPGSEEDQRGEPFVGPAGQLLDAMLGAIGLQRGDGVYIANAVKCRPPLNRTPAPDEMASCWPYLARQIALLQPRIVVALGRPAAQALLKSEVRISAARGQVFRYGETPVIVTYHPAYLLRNPADKAKTWEDLCLARRTVGQTRNA